MSRILLASVNTAIERLLVVDRNRPGEVHRLARDETLAGGKGVNVARVLHALRRRGESAPDPHLVGLLGGRTGELCADLLDDEGLPGTWVTVAGSTRVCEVLLDRSAPDRSTVYNAPGPRVDTAELAALTAAFDAELPGADALVCTGSLPADVPAGFYADLVRAARRSEVASLVDTHGPALRAAVAAGPDVVKVNRDEVREVAGSESADQVARRWVADGVRCVVVTDGPRPTTAHTATGSWTVHPPRVPVRSAVGSGDAFAAGLTTGLAHPDPDWPDLLVRAAAYGAANATSETAGLPDDTDLAALRAAVAITPGP